VSSLAVVGAPVEPPIEQVPRVEARCPPVQLTNVTLTHGRRPAVHHLSGRFEPGSLTAIVGPNGAGKSTLVRALAGLESRVEGRIDLGGLDPREIGHLPQQAALDRSFPLSCLDVALSGLMPRLGWFKGAGGTGRARAQDALDAVGLGGFGSRAIGSLSAGQFQRVLFARLLVQDPSFVLLDEPFNAIDARTLVDLLGVIDRWHAEARTVVVVLHDLDLARERFPETLFLARRPVAWGKTGSVLTSANRLQARSMAEAWADEASACDRAA